MQFVCEVFLKGQKYCGAIFWFYEEHILIVATLTTFISSNDYH